MKKALLTLILLFTFGVNSFAAWDPTKPVYDEYIYDDLAAIRANWAAIATGTDAALQITNAKVSASAAIVDTKLAQITTAGKVSGAALTLLGSVPSGSTALPIAAGGTGQTTRQAALNALSATSLSGTTGQGLVSDGTNMALGYPASLTIASAATGDILWFNGTAWVRLAPGTADYALVSNGAGLAPGYEQVNLATGVTGILPPANMGTGTPLSSNYLRGDGAWSALSAGNANRQVFTSSGTFTAPTGVSVVYITATGAGGGGGGRSYYGAGGGGGSGEFIIKYPYSVTAGNNYTVTINSAGTAGGDSQAGGTGGSVVFDTITLAGGSGGAWSGNYTGGAGGNGGGISGGIGGVAPVSNTGHGNNGSMSLGGGGGTYGYGAPALLGYFGGMGGGSGGSAGANGNSACSGGNGGSNPFGNGSRSKHHNGSSVIEAIPAGYGGGGAGRGGIGSGTQYNATAGGSGVVIVEW